MGIYKKLCNICHARYPCIIAIREVHYAANAPIYFCAQFERQFAIF